MPLCGAYDKKTNCCTQYSVSADLHSSLCRRANGCQDNCADDSGVNVPPAASTPTTTLSVGTTYPLPTPPPSQCGNCTIGECCSAMVSEQCACRCGHADEDVILQGTCEDVSSYYCGPSLLPILLSSFPLLPPS